MTPDKPLLALLLASFASVAATPIGAQVTSPELVDSVMIFAGTRLYPPGAAELGVQGKVTLRADLAADGSFSNPTIHESSRSETLDQAAVALAPRLKYTRIAAGAMPTAVLVPIDFLKDSSENLAAKSCADFNVDAEYFKGAFPEKSLTDMPVFDLAAGVLVFAVDADRRLALARNLQGIKERVIAACSESPDSKFLERAIRAAR